MEKDEYYEDTFEYKNIHTPNGMQRICIKHNITTELFKYEFNNHGAILTDYNDKNIESVIIPDKIRGYPVISIGGFAFDSCSNLTDIILPNSVTSIGASAFSNCISLRSIIIPASVILINDYVFSWNNNLKSIIFKSKIAPEINVHTFEHILSDYTIYIPENSKCYNTKFWKGLNIKKTIDLLSGSLALCDDIGNLSLTDNSTGNLSLK